MSWLIPSNSFDVHVGGQGSGRRKLRASAHLDAAAGHGVPDDQMTGQFADDEQTAGGLRVGEQQQVLLGDAGRGTQMRPDPVEVARVPPEMKPSRSASRAPSITGTAPRSMTAPTTPEARHILYRWPSSPKPVTSVAARTPAATAASAASRLSRVMVATASANTSPVCLSRLLSSPTPSGLVRVSGKGLGGVVAQQPSGVGHAGHRHAVLRASLASSVFHCRVRYPLEPPPSAQISNRKHWGTACFRPDATRFGWCSPRTPPCRGRCPPTPTRCWRPRRRPRTGWPCPAWGR